MDKNHKKLRHKIFSLPAAALALVLALAPAFACACDAREPDGDQIDLSDPSAEGIVTAAQLLRALEEGAQELTLSASIDLGADMLRLDRPGSRLAIAGNGFTISGNGDCLIRLANGCSLTLEDVSLNAGSNAIGCLGDASISGNADIRAVAHAINAQLGNLGATVTLGASPILEAGEPSLHPLQGGDGSLQRLGLPLRRLHDALDELHHALRGAPLRHLTDLQPLPQGVEALLDGEHLLAQGLQTRAGRELTPLHRADLVREPGRAAGPHAARRRRMLRRRTERRRTERRRTERQRLLRRRMLRRRTERRRSPQRLPHVPERRHRVGRDLVGSARRLHQACDAGDDRARCDERPRTEPVEQASDDVAEQTHDQTAGQEQHPCLGSIEAEDVLHDVFMRVFLHIDSFNTEMAFSSWIYRIAVNCCKNFRKKHMHDRLTVAGDQMDGINSPDGSPEDLYLKEEDMREFYLAVDSLKEKFRTVFLLRFDHGMQYSQISSILDCPERTAKWRMQKAVEKIVDRLKSRNVV